MLKLLEIFAGSRSVGRVGEFLGMQVRSVDIEGFDGVDIVGDLLAMKPSKFNAFKPDIIWASPPCTAFSVASMGRHWGDGKRAYQPKSATAYLGLALVKRTQEIIRANPQAVWFMENPRGVLRNLPIMVDFGINHTVTYCTYGDHRMKPTDVWTNCTAWRPKPMCKNRQPCHDAAPRGAKTGTQGLKDAHVRAFIPPALCMDALTAAMKQLRPTPAKAA